MSSSKPQGAGREGSDSRGADPRGADPQAGPGATSAGAGPDTAAGREGASAAGAGGLRDDLDALRLSERDKSAAGRPRRWRRALVAAVLLAAALLLVWRPWRSDVLHVATALAVPYGEARDEAIPVLSGTGYLVPAQPTIAVGSRVPGRIQRYLVEEGDRVEAGQPLVELDAKPFRAGTEQMQASLASARARRDLAVSELERARQLHAQGVLANEALERRESEARVARAAVGEIRAALARAEIDLGDAVIRAPVSGVVLETFKQPGEVAVPGGFTGSGDLLRLANLDELRAELDVNEADLTHVFLGQQAEVVPDAFPERTYAGRVVELAPQIDRQKGTRDVEVRVLEPDAHLLPDMSVRVVFLADLAREADGVPPGSVLVPKAALRRDDADGAWVWVVDDGRARRVAVEAGATLGERVVVRSGLAGGERLILGVTPDREGQRVLPAAAGS